MSNKNKSTKKKPPEEDITVDGYAQDEGELVPEEQIKKGGFLSRIPAPIKIFFVNFWFGGAVYFFVGWGIVGIDDWSRAAVLGLIYGLAGDLLINLLLKAMIPEEARYRRNILFHNKKFYSVLVNGIYGLGISMLITLFYFGVNMWAYAAGYPGDKIFLGAEPLLVGALYAGINLLCVTVKNALVKLFNRRGNA